MGIKLITEVLDNAPDYLTSGERCVLIVIAEWANDGTRVARQSKSWTIETLACRSGLKMSGLRKAFRGLAQKGFEVRIPVRYSKTGEPVYAFEGTAMTFRVPTFPERGCHSITSEVSPQHPRGEPVASERGDHSHPHPLNSPHLSPQVTDQNSPASSRFAPSGAGFQVPAQRATKGGLDDDEGTQIVAIINEPYEPPAASDYTRARATDRELFHYLVGENLKSDGSKFTEGTFRWDKFYDAFRRWNRKKKIEWPGKMLNKIAEDAPEGGVEDWLMYLGLENM